MRIREHSDGWLIEPANTVVQMIQIDFRVGLLLSDAANDLQIYLGTPFSLRSTVGVEHHLDPGKTTALGPVLNLFNAEVLKVAITKLGDLEISFQNGFVLQSSPDEAFEAWEALTRGIRLVCAPEGGVVVYESRADRPSEDKLN